MEAVTFNNAIVELKPRLERFACGLTGNKEDALDLLQDTFLRALTYREKFEDNTNLKAWVFTIMKNTFINENRKSKIKKAVIDKNSYHYIVNKQYLYDDPFSNLSHCEISSKIDALEEDLRIPFQMHTAGYKYKEIAERFNINIGTVKSRIYFSRQKLMKKLHDLQNQ